MVDPRNKNPIQTLLRLAPWTEQVKEITYLSGGYSNDNYYVSTNEKNYALRIRKRPRPSKNEQQYLKISNAPEVAAYDSMTGDMLTRWIDGELIADKPFTIKEAACYLRQLHSEIPSNISHYNVIERILTAVNSANYVKELIKKIGWKPQTIGPSHNDLNPWNIIRVENGFRTLDWEYAGNNDPIFDLVALCHGLEFSQHETKEVADAFVSNITNDHIIRTRGIFLLREHAWAVDQIQSGNARDEIVEQRDTCLEYLQHLVQEL